ncbi:MAG TPA: hypothetical protein PKK26_12270 [Candidatus Wallbacteria bacterium]|nr:hypothetical protein [Candidatus Wallbacteria bacterium]
MYKRIFNITIRLIFFIAAVLCFQPGALFALETDQLSDSEMVIMRPHKVGPTNSMVYIKETPESDITKKLRTTPEFVKQIRLYQQYQRENFENDLRKNFSILGEEKIKKLIAGYKPDPVYMVLDEGLVKGVSFATEKPFGLIETGADGKNSFSMKAAPLITLSSATINEIKTGDRWGYETVCHEMGHVIMYPTHGILRYPKGISENLIETMKKEGHWKDKITTAEFALLEGWAEFNGAYFTSQSISDYTKVDGRAKTADELTRTEGVNAKILLDICKSTEINSSSDAGYKKMIDTMTKHKPQTLNAFLTDYIKDYPSDKAAVEQIVKKDTNGVLSINYSYGIKDWFASKVYNVKNVWGTFKTWVGGLFNKKDKTKAAAVLSAPAIHADESRREMVESKYALKTNDASEDSGEILIKMKEKQKALYEKYKKALMADDTVGSEKLGEEIKNLNKELEK